jgi:hypothetical protein
VSLRLGEFKQRGSDSSRRLAVADRDDRALGDGKPADRKWPGTSNGEDVPVIILIDEVSRCANRVGKPCRLGLSELGPIFGIEVAVAELENNDAVFQTQKKPPSREVEAPYTQVWPIEGLERLSVTVGKVTRPL